MYLNDTQGLTADQVNQADTERTKRLFVGFLSSALGVDQTFANDDMNPTNAPGQYIVANPDGTYSTIGRSQSNLNSAQSPINSGLVITPGLILLAVAAFFLLKK